jgi:arylsulfatase A-like enzyme
MIDLSVIVIQIDSLNRHFLRCYGNDWVRTPNLDAFAQRAAVFDNHFVGSLPCMPARREIWAGVEEFWWRFWGPLEPWDQPIAHLARRSGKPIVTQLVTDHYHFFEWGSHSYFYDFHGYDFIRGHEMDNWRTDAVRAIPDWARHMVERRPHDGMVYLQNTQDFANEADFFAPKVMQTAAEWLDRNHPHKQFYLHIDSFDVHEPFHIPEPYRSMYTDEDYRSYNPWPHYGRVDSGPSALDTNELAWVRAQFAGKLSMVDHWLGRLFERLDRYKLWERTAVIISTDHGHYLGEHGWIGKPAAPLYHTLCHIPLLVWHPQFAAPGQHVSAVTQTVDLYATVLELLGVEQPMSEHIHSRSFAPVLRGEANIHRDYAVYGYNNKRVGITAGEWTLLRFHDPDAAPPALYTHNVQQGLSFGMGQRDHRALSFPDLTAGQFIPGVDTPTWRMTWPQDWARDQAPRDDLLFHNPSDSGQEHSLVDQHPDELRRLAHILSTHANALGAPEEARRRLRLND